MFYYTQVLFVIEGQEATFDAFEDPVLPRLQHHKGTLLYRVRPSPEAVLATTLGYPYEVHLLSFARQADFEAYRNNPHRLAYSSLKEQSIHQVLLIEGKRL